MTTHFIPYRDNAPTQRLPRQMPAREYTSDNAAKYAAWTDGTHRRQWKARPFLEGMLLTMCLLMGAAVLLLAVKLPVQLDLLRILALMLSGALFNTFVLGMIDRIDRR